MVGLAMWAVGCGDSGSHLELPDLHMPDMGGEGPDMSATPSTIGGPCTSNANCIEGKMPVCFLRTLFNNSSYLKTTGGYCSSKCSSDADCGANGVCVDEGTLGMWCYASCSQASDCRSPGYACLYFTPNHCFPNGNLDCDPTADGGVCTTAARKPGGCLRQAFGAGKEGSCSDSCSVGAGTCPAQNGNARQCLVIDARGYTDPSASGPDTFVGPVCIASGSSNATGTACMTYLDNCVDGDECYLSSVFTSGDDKCHSLCVEGGGNPDGGAPPCASPSSCHDVWGLFGTSHPVGLCY
jgi:hypothetical protein